MEAADAPELGGGAAADQTLGLREAGQRSGERSEVVSICLTSPYREITMGSWIDSVGLPPAATRGKARRSLGPTRNGAQSIRIRVAHLSILWR